MLDTYRMFAYDEGWSRRINEAIDSGPDRRGGDRARPATHARTYAANLRPAARRPDARSWRIWRTACCEIVSGQLGTAAQAGLRQDTILIARNLGPAEMLEYDGGG